MEYQIVVARYNEDISYLSLFSNIMIVYNKGLPDIPLNFDTIILPNIGRESHTYLYHIIQNYDNLANKTFFIQGRINDHKLFPMDEYFKNENFIAKKSKHDIDMLKSPIVHSGKYLKDFKNGNLKRSKYTPYEWINKIGIDISKCDNFEMIWGANFSISKDIILKKPKIFYENLMKYIEYDINPEEGHFFERSWNLIFNHPTFRHKKIILYYDLSLNKINDNFIKRCKDILLNDSNIFEIHLWSNNIVNNNLFQIKYINCDLFIPIYPLIENNLFNIKINESVDLLLFFNNIIFKLEIDDYCVNLYDINSDKKIGTFIKKKNNIYEDYIIKWNRHCLFILNKINNHILLKYLGNNLQNILKIKIRSNKDFFIDYFNNINNNSKIFLFCNQNNDKFNKIFYKDNFEDYIVGVGNPE
jgi:hypothetical protein